MDERDRTPMTNKAESALVHTKDISDFQMPDGQPDPRGWSVKSADGTTLGKVEDLLYDTGESRIRYIEVKTDGDISRHGGRDYFLLPIGAARLDDEHDDVVVDMAAEELTGVPAYERGNMSREYETSLRDYVRERPGTPRTAAGAASTTPVGIPAAIPAGAPEREISFYGTPEYDDASFFTRRHNKNLGANPSSTTDSDSIDRRI